MAEDEYKRIFSKNLKYYMELNNKNQMDLMKDLGLSSSTVSNWCTGLKLPRMDKVQILADYFGILKSDLIEEKQKPAVPLIIQYYNSLNDLGKSEAIKRVEELTYFPRYTTASANNITCISQSDSVLNAAHADAGASAEDKKHDEDIMNDNEKWGN